MLEHIENNSVTELMSVKHDFVDTEVLRNSDLKQRSSGTAEIDPETSQDRDSDLEIDPDSDSKQECFSAGTSSDWQNTVVTDLDSKHDFQMNVDVNSLLEGDIKVRTTMSSSKERSKGLIYSNSGIEFENTGLSGNDTRQNIQTASAFDRNSESERVYEAINVGIDQAFQKSNSFPDKKKLKSRVFGNDDLKDHDPKLKTKTPKATRISTHKKMSKSTRPKTESRSKRKHLSDEGQKNDGIHPPQNLFCNICSRWFKSLTKMETHDCSVTMKHICEICGKGFRYQVLLENHLKVHRNIRDFHCHICEKTFTTLPILTRHLSAHTLPWSHTCKICGHSFKLPSDLRYHSLIHTHRKRTVFKDIKPENAENYISFDKSCSAEPKVKKKPFKVKDENLCGDETQANTKSIIRTLGTVKSVENAVNIKFIKKENGDGNALYYLCNLCPKTFSSKRAHKKHTECHERTTCILKCRICCKNFESQSALQHHVMSHNRPFKCNLCGVGFDRKDVAKRHLRTHSDIRPFQCSLCDQKFKTKESWNRHVKNIHEGRTDVQTKPCPFSCRLCHKTFLHAHHVDRHMRIHSKVKPYRCQRCDRCFTERHHLSRHQLVHDILVSEV